jgi:5-methylcytosine-specific restriction endonuclease McrA
MPATSSDPLSLDHVVPLAVHLDFHPSDGDLVTAHRSCNARKGARVPRGGADPSNARSDSPTPQIPRNPKVSPR